jgi:hypothetical protein
VSRLRQSIHERRPEGQAQTLADHHDRDRKVLDRSWQDSDGQARADAAGRALLDADHGHLSARLEVAESVPTQAHTKAKSVRLVQQKAQSKKKKVKMPRAVQLRLTRILALRRYSDKMLARSPLWLL